MLVPHEPDLDPRIRWVTNLCSQVGRTDIIGFVWATHKPEREYDGAIYVERVTSTDYPLPIYQFLLATNLKHLVYEFLVRSDTGRRLIDSFRRTMVSLGIRKVYDHDLPSPSESQVSAPRSGSSVPDAGAIPLPASRIPNQVKASSPSNEVRHKKSGALIQYRESLKRFIKSWYAYFTISNALYMRSRAVSIVPRVIICHDIYALGAAVKLKRLFGCSILYDSHELWPEADLQALDWEKRGTEIVERKLIRQADAVITVTPQIARQLEIRYGIEHVLSVPNAEPLMETSLRIQEQPVVFPLRFLVQGNVSMGRGFDELLYCWSQLEDDRAVLVLRCPENPYFEELLEKYDPLIRTGMVLIAEPVKESQLVEAASFADVGIIPYGGPSLNHVYACPNKLSQYMQAGLAILHHADQEYVSQVIQLHRCGLSYNPANPETLKKAVRQLIDNPLELATLKRNAYRAARSEFNWQVQSKPYLDSIMKFYGS